MWQIAKKKKKKNCLFMKILVCYTDKRKLKILFFVISKEMRNQRKLMTTLHKTVKKLLSVLCYFKDLFPL